DRENVSAAGKVSREIEKTSQRPEKSNHPPPHHRQPSLQVLSLRMRDRHRMIRRGGQGFEKRDSDSGFDGGGEEDLAEELGVDRSAATEGEEEAAGGHALQGEAVQVLVGAGR